MRFSGVVEVAKSARVIVSLTEVTQVLTLMGLTLDDLHSAIEAGEVDRDSCNANNPPTDAGSRAHGTTVRVLRERKIPDGWAACNTRNFATVVSPSRDMEIAVASGDDKTADPECEPKTKNKKGELVAIGIERNRLQYQLPIELPRAERTKTRDAATIWILLRYRVEGTDIVRSELSVPFEMGDRGRVEKWGTRVILPELDLGNRGGTRAELDEQGEESIDIPVIRRSI